MVVCTTFPWIAFLTGIWAPGLAVLLAEIACPAPPSDRIMMGDIVPTERAKAAARERNRTMRRGLTSTEYLDRLSPALAYPFAVIAPLAVADETTGETIGETTGHWVGPL